MKILMDLFQVIFFGLLNGDFTVEIHFFAQRSGYVLIRVQIVIIFDEMKADLPSIAHVFQDLFFEVNGEEFIFGDHFEDLNDFLT
jgi:hypothetical protein